MISTLFSLLFLVKLVSAGSYAPPSAVQPSPLVYGAQLPLTPNGYNSYGNLGGGLALPQPPQPLPPIIPPSPPAPILPLPPAPAPAPPVNPPQTYSYPIQAGSQQSYGSASTVYSDQFETTTLSPVQVTPAVVPTPVIEQVEDPEQYGIPEFQQSFNANPRSSSAQPVPVVVTVPPQPAGGYAPPPVVQPAPSAYGAPPPPAPVSSPSYGGTTSYNDLEYNAGEVPAAVVQPGSPSSIPTALPFSQNAASALDNFYPPRAIRAQKKTLLKAKKM